MADLFYIKDIAASEACKGDPRQNAEQRLCPRQEKGQPVQSTG